MGSHSGRLDPANYAGVADTFAWVFGTDLPGTEGELAIGDEVEISQSVDFTALTLLTFQAKFLQPDNSGAMKFKLEVSVAGTVEYTLQPAEGDARDFVQRTIRVDQYSGAQTLRFKVTAVA